MKNFIVLGILSLVVTVTPATSTMGQQVSAEITTDEGYVGVPIQLEIKIANAEDYDLPELPEIDGCKVEFLGTPSRSSRVSIINGRQYKTTTITAVYSFTPMQAGEFIIPEMEILVDGKKQTLAEYTFSAIQSETGDLLFVEIEGQKDSVYVGQPLDLILKIYLKPFHDKDRKIKMQIGDMWSSLSRNSSWGDFLGRLQEMAESRTRPSGREVIRKDGDGKDAIYYLYEIESTVYPNRPGKIDSEGVQIVVDYPVKIGRSRPAFDDLFFSRRSRGFAVTETRPIVASATVDSTEVLSVPLKGRPADYRGAVGSYQMVSEVEPDNVAAGDPMTLRLAIIGDGPMELVQAPPLSEIGSLTVDFKTEDQNLAGFVKEDNTKIFVTTIRPRRAGIEQVPAIPFSFFDPDKGEFKTVFSDPIEITVSDSEQLSLDAIVGNGRSRNQTNPLSDSSALSESEPPSKFPNVYAKRTLVSQRSKKANSWWVWLGLLPAIWLSVLIYKYSMVSDKLLRIFRPPSSLAKAAIARKLHPEELEFPLTDYIFKKFNLSGPLSLEVAIGVLRSNGHLDLAIQTENMIAEAHQFQVGKMPDDQLSELKERFIGLIDEIDLAAKSSMQKSIRRMNRNNTQESFMPGKMTLLGFCCFALSAFSNPALAEEAMSFTDIQKQTIFMEANEFYRVAQKEDSIDDFERAASKYQLLVDSGIQNADLFLNLGNAQLQSEQTGHAIASYLRGLKLAPFHRPLNTNLQLAKKRITDSSESESTPKNNASFSVTSWNALAVNIIGWPGIFALSIISSIFFWGSLILKTLEFRMAITPILIISGIVLALSVASLWLDSTQNRSTIAIAVVSEIELRPGDGMEFPVGRTIVATEGMQFDVLAQRKGWIQIETAEGESGWASADNLEVINH